MHHSICIRYYLSSIIYLTVLTFFNDIYKHGGSGLDSISTSNGSLVSSSLVANARLRLSPHGAVKFRHAPLMGSATELLTTCKMGPNGV